MAFQKKYRLIILLISLLASWTNRAEAQSGGGSLAISKQVSRSKVSVGDTLTYTLIVSNSGTIPATNLVVRDSGSVGLRYLPESARIPTGSNFTPGMPISSWQVPSVGAGQSLTLTFRSVADSSGIFYNQATIPGDTATTCTTVPIKVCAGDDFLFRLTVPAGRSSYRWFRNGIELAGQTTNLLEITTPGSYSVSVDDVTGKCPDFSQCPFIIEEDPLPTFQAKAIPATCTANTIQANGQIVLTNFNPAYTYQYAAGPSFSAGLSLSGNPQPIPSTGILADNLPSPVANTPYTVRVYNTAGCYTDQTVTLQPATCCMTAVVSAGNCQTATNTYTSTVIITLSNPTTGTLTVTDGAVIRTLATTSGTSSLTAVFADLPSDASTHTIMVSLPGCSSLTSTYTAPASCTSIQACVAPTFSAKAVGVTCIGNALQSNGQIILSDFNPAYTYQYSAGASFDPAASLSGAAQTVPPGGLIVNNLVNPATDQFYTVRVYNELGCSTDVTVVLRPTVCGCPPDQCVPFVITQTQRGKRIGG
ncbi:DUF11 domain-containing protein [Spirosoma aureum]|uniref:DUF11 domain-containing protein n=1 Tax=Spirosoma aureum TaxID=2692134 RepID=A0A6G9AXD7_9BACT|nr:DUF11 domain-containing protein [Spirosoma aureum]QIP17044.1 DUF11 domain-containing protein [Spirosoma aureum]